MKTKTSAVPPGESFLAAGPFSDARHHGVQYAPAQDLPSTIQVSYDISVKTLTMVMGFEIDIQYKEVAEIRGSSPEPTAPDFLIELPADHSRVLKAIFRGIEPSASKSLADTIAGGLKLMANSQTVSVAAKATLNLICSMLPTLLEDIGNGHGGGLQA